MGAIDVAADLRQLLRRADADLWDLAEDVGRLLERSDELELTPACCDLLLSLDDAITAAVRGDL
ncbi:MAG TPA: hypothetical protein VFU56_06915 [Gaiellaceae bacterium]|nr:hypothetical protein [Gaiellaceae bacterium]